MLRLVYENRLGRDHSDQDRNASPYVESDHSEWLCIYWRLPCPLRGWVAPNQENSAHTITELPDPSFTQVFPLFWQLTVAGTLSRQAMLDESAYQVTGEWQSASVSFCCSTITVVCVRLAEFFSESCYKTGRGGTQDAHEWVELQVQIVSILSGRLEWSLSNRSASCHLIKGLIVHRCDTLIWRHHVTK